jgi:hypothetical protein
MSALCQKRTHARTGPIERNVLARICRPLNASGSPDSKERELPSSRSHSGEAQRSGSSASGSGRPPKPHRGHTRLGRSADCCYVVYCPRRSRESRRLRKACSIRTQRRDQAALHPVGKGLAGDGTTVRTVGGRAEHVATEREKLAQDINRLRKKHQLGVGLPLVAQKIQRRRLSKVELREQAEAAFRSWREGPKNKSAAVLLHCGDADPSPWLGVL